MRCQVCAASLNASDSIPVTIKLPSRLNQMNEVVLPEAQTVYLECLEEESVECAACGELLPGIPSAKDKPEE